MQKKTNSNLAVLVISCDAYSDLWSPFFKLYFRYWSDNKFDTFLLSNFKKYSDSRVGSIIVGEDKSWSNNLINALKKLDKYEYVLLLMEDGFFKEKVDDVTLNGIIKKFTLNKGNFLTLINEPEPNKPYDRDYGEISIGAPYRSTATFAVWKINTLLSLLDGKENAWEFEKKGAIRSDKFDQFYSVYHDQFKVIHGVIKGQWLSSAIEELKALGIKVKTDRGIYSNKYQVFLSIYKVVRKVIFKITPFKFRRKLVKY
jgi:hypothetical protein